VLPIAAALWAVEPGNAGQRDVGLKTIFCIRLCGHNGAPLGHFQPFRRDPTLQQSCKRTDDYPSSANFGKLARIGKGGTPIRLQLRQQWRFPIRFRPPTPAPHCRAKTLATPHP
jgi:hypothetical protein